MDILPISGFDPSFSWQVGFSSNLTQDNLQQFRATIRPLNGLEQFTRIPNNIILYEETGIVINSVTNQGQWSFPLSKNSSIDGGPYRDYQVVIEAYDTGGNTSAGNLLGNANENGWVAYSAGYDVIAIQNPRQTGIELSNNLPTQYTIISGAGETGFSLHSDHGYSTLNYMGTHGEINIRYLTGTFNSNLVGGYIYAWTGQFPKRETLLGISGYNNVIKSQFSFDPTLGYVYHPTAAMAFRGANNVYVSLSFYDNLDQEALDNGIDISTGLYLSDNAICYNDIAAGSISIGGFNTIYGIQYSGNGNPTGVIGTGVFIIYSGIINNITSLLYMPQSINIQNISSYSGVIKNSPGGAGGDAILLNNKSISKVLTSFVLNVSDFLDDCLVVYLNEDIIRETSIPDGSAPYIYDILSFAASSGKTINVGDVVTFKTKDLNVVNWTAPTWIANISYLGGQSQVINGGSGNGGSSLPNPPTYHDDGYLIVGSGLF